MHGQNHIKFPLLYLANFECLYPCNLNVIRVFFNIKPAIAHPEYTIVGAFIEAIRLYVLGVCVCWFENKKI